MAVTDIQSHHLIRLQARRRQRLPLFLSQQISLLLSQNQPQRVLKKYQLYKKKAQKKVENSKPKEYVNSNKTITSSKPKPVAKPKPAPKPKPKPVQQKNGKGGLLVMANKRSDHR